MSPFSAGHNWTFLVVSRWEMATRNTQALPVLARFKGSGSLGARRIHRETLLSETSKPSLSNSPLNARSSPGRILGNHTEAQGANLFADTLSSSYVSDSGDPCPIQTKLSRCQLTTVLGVTRSRDFLHPDQNVCNASQNSLCRAVNRW